MLLIIIVTTMQYSLLIYLNKISHTALLFMISSIQSVILILIFVKIFIPIETLSPI